MYEIGAWNVSVPGDIEIYSSDGKVAELIPHSQYGFRFKQDSTLAEKQQLLRKTGKAGFVLR